MPMSRKRLRQSMLMVFSTLAFTMALSTLLTTSKTINPATMSIDSTKDNAYARQLIATYQLKSF
jgi:hypothetical protein